MADDFKTLVALTKETNAKLDALNKATLESDSPKNRILDGLPEIIGGERIAKRERIQRDKNHKGDIKDRKKHLEDLKKADEDRTKKSDINRSRQNTTPIVEEIKKSTVLAKITSTAITDQTEKIKLTLGNVGNLEPYLETGLKDSKSFKEILTSVGDYLNKPMTIAQGKEDSRSAEDKAKADKRQNKMNKIFSSMNDSLKGMASAGFDKIKSGFSGLAKFALGGLALAALAFLNDPVFQKIAFDFTEYIIPKLAYVYKEYIKPIGKALKKFLIDLDKVFKGEKTWFELLKGNKAVSAAIAAIFAPGLFIGIFSVVGSIALQLLGLVSSAAIKAALLASPIFLRLGGIAAVAAGLYNMAVDGIDEYNKKQDFSKAFSTALAGKGKGMSGALSNAASMKFAAVLGGLGMFLSQIGGVIGFGIGLMLDGILGYFGADAIDAGLGKIKDSIMSVVDGIVSFVDNFITNLVLGAKKLFGIALTEAEKKQSGKAKFEVAKTMAQAGVALENEGKKEYNANARLVNEGLDFLGVKKRIPLLQKSKLDPKFDSQDTYETSIFNQNEIARALRQVTANRDKHGNLDELDEADLNDAMPMAILNSGNTVTNTENNNPTLVETIALVNADPFIQAFAKANTQSFSF